MNAMRYADTQVVFREVPGEITLAVNIAGCPFRCAGCHSPWLQEDRGEPLDEDALLALVAENDGVTCVALMGGDADATAVERLLAAVKAAFPGMKTCWYSGGTMEAAREAVGHGAVDYLKVGPYVAALGPLDNPATNQRMYRITMTPDRKGAEDVSFEDITPLFWQRSIDKKN